MNPISTVMGTPIEAVPEPLRSALQERLERVPRATDGLLALDALTPLDFALFERLAAWQQQVYRDTGRRP